MKTDWATVRGMIDAKVKDTDQIRSLIVHFGEFPVQDYVVEVWPADGRLNLPKTIDFKRVKKQGEL